MRFSSQRDRDAMRCNAGTQSRTLMWTSGKLVANAEQVLITCWSPFCSEDDMILRTSRLAYNFHNSSRLQYWSGPETSSSGCSECLVVLHGHSLPPRALPHRVRITHHAFTVSRQSRIFVSSLLPLWLSLSLSRPLFRSSWDLMAASARSSAGLSPRRYRRLAHKGEI
jgi:hypothetical protein